jgi:uracil phosphoribosyltransferase
MPVHVVNHPLLRHKLTVLRQKETSMRKFRELVSEITLLLAYEATRDLPETTLRIETPLCPMDAPVLEDEGRLVVVPILRSGLGMVHGMLEILPLARVAHLGLRRNEETAEAEWYLRSLPPDIGGSNILVCDPMLATAGTLCAAVRALKEMRPRRISALCLIAAPEGVARMGSEHPDVHVYLGAVDSHLNDHKFIVPGLGDAGDRMFGT